MTADPAPQGISLRVSVTDRCQLRCRYCMPPEGVPLGGKDDILTYEEIVEVVGCLRQEFGLAKVRITGGEPLVRAGIEQLVAALAGLRIPDLALTTNGLRLAELAPALKRAGLHRVNVSLDSLSPSTYRRMARSGEPRDVRAGIDAALQAGLAPMKLNAVVMRGFNDTEVVDLLEFAIARNCELRFIELMPIGPGAGLFHDHFVSSADVRRRLSSCFELHHIGMEAGSSAQRYRAVGISGRQGMVGFISSCSLPFCGECSRVRLTADGRLIGCLARDGGVSVRDALRGGDKAAIGRVARQVVRGKTPDRIFEQSMAMAAIGG
jgi:cyclic pyranopterin phosphate synthase